MEKENILILVRNALIVVAVGFFIFGLNNLYAKDDLKACEVGNTDLDCYMDFYEKKTMQDGVDEAFKFLKKEYKVNPYVVSQCHPITHVIGHAGLKLYPEVYEAFNHGDPYCWSGYYHGVMEEIAERIGIENVIKELNNICSTIPGKESYSFNYYNCVHGLGHGVMAVNNDELFIALDICSTLVGDWEKESCYGGVFMENVIIDNKGEFTKFLKPEDPLYPCNAVDLKYKSSCYLMQTSYALKVRNQDFAKIFEICRTADKGFESICFQSLGRDASGSTSSNAEKTKERCDLGKDYFEKSNCITGAVKDFISYFHSDKEAKKFCSSLTPDLKENCLTVAESYYKTF